MYVGSVDRIAPVLSKNTLIFQTQGDPLNNLKASFTNSTILSL